MIFLASKKVADEAGPDFRDTIEKVQGNLTLPVIQELNSEVDIDKKEPAAVAHNYLVRAGTSSRRRIAVKRGLARTGAGAFGPRRRPTASV